MTDLLGFVGLFVAAVAAGALNAVAGGGSLISFPALVAFGQPAILANATNTAALWPGSLSSALAYRRDTLMHRELLVVLLLPSLLGGLLGALVLVNTPPDLFDRVVPFLVAFATVLFAARDVIGRWTKAHARGEEHVGWAGKVWGFWFQLFVATYGGYFGAGIGILMLAALSIMGLTDIHEMNSLKVVFGGSINGIAAAYFIWAGMVQWTDVLVMAIAAILGGWGGAGTARRIGRTAVRRIVVGLGFVMAISLFIKK